MFIINDLNKKISQYENSKNYYVKIKNDIGTTTEYYNKDDNGVLFLTSASDNGEKRILKNYFKGETTNTYIESGNDKIVLLNSNAIPGKINIISELKTDNLWYLFLLSASASIKSGNYNEKTCYIIHFSKYYEIYIDKETGLRLSATEGAMINDDGKETLSKMEYKYEFNNVDDNIFIEPDINEYIIK